ncbi:MAG: phosphatase PAP2 family protein [Rubrivivax sp.]|nr:phosphatase PAP2 family protein [Rubrivivax sp.]
MPQGFDESSWGAFFQQVRDEIAAVIWPRWEAGAWVGQAVARMGALTRADLDLMDTQLRRWHLQPVGAQGDLALVTHKALFTAEDDMPHSGGTFETARRYLAAQPPAVVTGVVAAAVRALGAMGPRPLAFKRELQRPRPYQAQMLLGQPFNYEWAKSAVTPSIMSGHCLQGVFAATWSYVDQQQQIETLPGARLALQKFGVDFGDRRVFAGVHYPSDNVASWYIGLKLADVCFGSQAGPARCFMADAIRLSRVYTAMKQAAVDAGSPYGVLLTWVDGAM